MNSPEWRASPVRLDEDVHAKSMRSPSVSQDSESDLSLKQQDQQVRVKDTYDKPT